MRREVFSYPEHVYAEPPTYPHAPGFPTFSAKQPKSALGFTTYVRVDLLRKVEEERDGKRGWLRRTLGL